VLCSNCGHDNPAMNRFCGMCGTPLPQKPITTPGAQSTLSFSHQPLESPQRSSPGSPVATQLPAADASPRRKTRPSAASRAPSPGAGASRTAAAHLAPTSVAEHKEPASSGERSYFTQAEEAESLEQFIAGFHYKPPSEEDELTMTGDKPILDSEVHAGAVATSNVSEEPTEIVEAPEPAPLETESTPRQEESDIVPQQEEVPYIESRTMEPPPFAMKNARTPTPERSGFLDLSEPASPEMPVEAAPSIGGPSFLGLSDTPALPPEDVGKVAPRSHWRAWVAAIVILTFAGLGALEWRAEKNQSSSGPIGVMKMQIERLKGKKGAVVTPASTTGTATEAAPAAAQPGASGPDVQVVPEQKPSQTTPPSNGNKPAGAPEKPATPGASSTTPAAPAPQTQAQPAKETAAPEQAQSNNTNGPATEGTTSEPAGTNAAQTSGKETQGPKSAPGAEELSRAQNASDAAAASAWLWKSVAKGNPEAPIKLANMYIKGDGVPQNCEQALVLLRSAAAKENAAASSRLGSMYAAGTCVPRDRVRAYEYISSAVEANPNAAWARDFRQQLWAHMTPQERSQAQKYR